ncbi:hypothetical protein [Sphingobium sp. EM0848]|uniref:hypothetical protein n=1 Tax=Sphingobium sp. EM0848 TaxID=2743473 RepID=UPI002100EC4B|nr:hypothetical protein [Sphingobium sp. EM0848]
MNQTASGRPVRFFALVMAGWIVIRLLSPGGEMAAGPTPPPAPAPTKIRAASAETGHLLWQVAAQPERPFAPILRRPVRRASVQRAASQTAAAFPSLCR